MNLRKHKSGQEGYAMKTQLFGEHKIQAFVLKYFLSKIKYNLGAGVETTTQSYIKFLSAFLLYAFVGPPPFSFHFH